MGKPSNDQHTDQMCKPEEVQPLCTERISACADLPHPGLLKIPYVSSVNKVHYVHLRTFHIRTGRDQRWPLLPEDRCMIFTLNSLPGNLRLADRLHRSMRESCKPQMHCPQVR